MSQSQSRRFYVDGHVHIGRAGNGAPVKMAASKHLTLPGLLQDGHRKKGLDLLGVIDAATLPVLQDLEELIKDGRLFPIRGGGLFAPEDELTLMLGAEVEIAGPVGGGAHFGVFVGTMEALKELSEWLAAHETNAALSSQRARATAGELGRLAGDLDGLLIVNHAFTPHKGMYGNCVRHMHEMLPSELVTAVELGLSADTAMADRLSELRPFSFVTNSDAHSLAKLAREYHVVELPALNFTNYKDALVHPQSRQLKANVGLWPELGKYHLSFCKKCFQRWDSPASACPHCGSGSIVQGVWNRFLQIADEEHTLSPDYRPPYLHQIPLEWIPGLGAQATRRLHHAFGTEMRILNEVAFAELELVVGNSLATAIEKARTGNWSLVPGAGGHYGQLARI